MTEQARSIKDVLSLRTLAVLKQFERAKKAAKPR